MRTCLSLGRDQLNELPTASALTGGGSMVYRDMASGIAYANTLHYTPGSGMVFARERQGDMREDG